MSARRHALVPSPVGDLTVVADGDALVALLFDGHLRHPGVEALGERASRGDRLITRTADQLDGYFARERTTFDLPLAPVGEPFQLRVWEQLRAIPYGRTSTYGALATALGDRNLAQAVGSANGSNPLSIVVPCHRVIGSDGSLTGYAGGLERKRFLPRP
ncbi:methylated-DNA--[protein]-cysteine S-methyltransferase [Janibacter sp. G1551]|uniref:methylated-DNA--[protein]-cysteine S-methyltransferase n=1 Tax=Janibacter sp. G1551 TaxID=3420440 RepID=UPI003D024D57